MKAKTFLWTVVVLILVALFAGRAWYLHTQKQTEKSEKIVKIGLLLPMSGGSVDIFGPWSFDSAKIAEDVLNASGLYNFKIKVLLQDGKMTPKGSIDAFNKLVAEGVKAVLVLGDTPTYAVAQFTKDAKMPTLSVSGMENLQELSPYFFRISIKNSYLMPQLARYATQVKKVRKVAILHIKVPMALKTVEAFIENVKQGGATITARESFAESATEARTQILKLLDTKPDALFIFGWNTAYANAINYAREMGFSGPILTDLNVDSMLYMIKKKDNIFFATTTFFDATDKYGYVQKFKKGHAGQEPNGFNAFVYVGVSMLADAVLKSDASPDNILRELKQTEALETPFGKTEFQKNGDILVPFVVKEILPDGSEQIVAE